MSEADRDRLSDKITGEVKPARPGALTEQLRRKRAANKKSTAAKKRTAKKRTATASPAPAHDAAGSLTQAIERTEQWFEKNQWTVFDFQRKAWEAWHQ